MGALACPFCGSSARFRLFCAYPAELYVSPKDGDPLAGLDVQIADEPYVQDGECLACNRTLPPEFLRRFRLEYVPERR